MSYIVRLNRETGIAKKVDELEDDEIKSGEGARGAGFARSLLPKAAGLSPSGEVVEIKSGEGARGAGLAQRRTPQTMTKTGAIRLANIIARYWRERGAITVKLRVERDFSMQEFELWTVRSNLIGGLPPKAAG